MIQELFIRVLELSLPASICIIIMLICSPFLEKKYTARLRYGIWLLILIRLIIPLELPKVHVPIKIEVDQYSEFEIVPKTLFPEAVGQDENVLHQKQAPKDQVDYVPVVSGIWLVIGILILSYSLISYIGLIWRIKKVSEEVDDHRYEVLLRVKKEFNIKNPIRLRVMKGIASPMLLSMVRSTIILPEKHYSELDLYLILKHEIIHYKHHDLLVKLIMLLTKGLYWFNPLIYLMKNSLNQSIEMACDEEVISNKDASIKKHYIETILAGIDMKKRTPIVTLNYNGGMINMKKRLANIACSNKKKKGTTAFVLGAAMLLAMSTFVGCNIVHKEEKNETEVTNPVAKGEGETKEVQVVENITETQVDIDGMYDEAESNIKGIKSEGDDELIKAAVNEYMEFSDEEGQATRYYYNLVDLNNDGEDEAFVVLMGMYTSGSGGSTALIMEAGETHWNVVQKLTLIQTPVIISQNVVNGWHEIITYRSGGGTEGAYVVLTVEDGQYTSVNDGKVIENLDNVFGTAIINNDIAKEIEEGIANYLK